MSAPPRKRCRFDTNPYIDIEAVVDQHNELEQDKDKDDLQFIDDESMEELEESMNLNHQRLVDLLREYNSLENDAVVEEEDHSGLLHKWAGLDLENENMDNPLDDGIDDDKDEDASVPRPPWAGIACVNAAVAGALNTW